MQKLSTQELKDLQRHLDDLSPEDGWKEIHKLIKAKKLPSDPNISEYYTYLYPAEYVGKIYLQSGQIGYLAHLLIKPSKALLMAVKVKDLGLVRRYLGQKCPITQETYWRAMEHIGIFKLIHNAANPKMILTVNTLPENLKLITFLLNFYQKRPANELNCLNHVLRLIYTYIKPELRITLKLKDIWTRQQGQPIQTIEIPDPIDIDIDLQKIRERRLSKEEIEILKQSGIPDIIGELEIYYSNEN